jgi:hypothetical protein
MGVGVEAVKMSPHGWWGWHSNDMPAHGSPLQITLSVAEIAPSLNMAVFHLNNPN